MTGRLDAAAEITPLNREWDHEAMIDMARLRSYRLGRTREQLSAADVAGALLFDPCNIRYATGYRLGPFQMHLPLSYLFIATDGPIVLFGPRPQNHDSIDEFRPAIQTSFFLNGSRFNEQFARWAAEIADLVTRHGGGNKRLAVDRGEPQLFVSLAERDVEVTDAQEWMERARLIKSPEEIQCMNYAIAAAEIGMARMYEACEPGITENELWSLLWQANMAMGGEWIEGRLFSSGERTNPWAQECSDRVIRPGDIVAFDTDMIGPYGYCADISRTFHAGPGSPTDAQRDLYKTALEQIEYNLALLKPGLGFREWTESAWKLPEDCVAHRYPLIAHGVGMCDEYPGIYYPQDWEAKGYDGEVEPGMVLCVESYIGPGGAREGVKLERQALITETGYLLLDRFPWDESLAA